MGKIFFTKMSGAGNDFILIDKNINPGLALTNNLIKSLCDRRNGIGADGLITILNDDENDFSMEYYNADGNIGSLCGNGARCAIKFAKETNRIKNSKAVFLSNGEKFSGEVLNDNIIKFYLNSPMKFKSDFKIKASGQLINSNFVDTGSPHVVIFIQDILKNPEDLKSFYTDINEIPVFDLGKEIRYLKDFEYEGANVNFIQLINDKIYIRTYERGVEDETLACGTGSAASAIVIFKNKNLKPPFSLITRGGEELIVDFNIQNETIKNLSLTGPAKIIYKGEFSINS